MLDKKKLIRQIALFPLVMASWVLVVVLGDFSLQFASMNFCPDGFGGERHCYAPSWHYVELGFRVFWSGISAIAVVVVAFVVAPIKKVLMADIFYAIGVIVATILAVSLNEWLPWLSALTCGFFSLWLIRSFAIKS